MRMCVISPKLAIAALLMLAPPRPDASVGPGALVSHPMDSPAGPESAQPQLSASDRGVLLSWIERAGSRATLKFAERTAGGWTEAGTVASGDNWFVNWADVPSVVRLADGTLAAHWLQMSSAEKYSYDVRLSYSRDDGRTWAAPFAPHHDGTNTEHGFASLFQIRGGGLGVVWLDGRSTKPAGHGGHGTGAMMLRFAAFDATWKQVAEVVVDDRVCECCPTAAAVTAEGPIAAFRDRTENETRDIHVTRFAGGTWTPSRPVHDDGWTVPACPVNGPALSARGRTVAIAWFTVKEEQGRAFAAFSSDAGRTFGAPIRLDHSGSLGRVDIELLAGGTAAATWIEFADQRAQFRTRLIREDGTAGPPATIAGLEGGRASGYPRVARHGDELVFAWTESAGGKLSVKAASASFTSRSPTARR